MSSLEWIAVVLIAAGAALALVFTKQWHGRWTGDFEDSGVQKHHKGSPPRIGGLALAGGLLAGWLALRNAGGAVAAEAARTLALLGLCSLPVVLLGLLEDTTKRVRPRWRGLGGAISAVAGIHWLATAVPSVGIGLLDPLVQWAPVAVVLTVLLVTGFTHAMNIVDGLNGLASGLALVMLGGTAYAAAQAHDPLIVELCMVLGAVTLGFVLVNFPRGSIFLGDGGAYLLGFALVQVWILLVVRNPGEVSPWFIVAVAFHPTMETVFSIVRRKLHPRKLNATAPDRLHLHTLLYRRKALLLTRHVPWAEPWVANAAAGLNTVLLASPPVLLAVMDPGGDGWQMGVVVLAALAYLGWFGFLVRWAGWRKVNAAGRQDGERPRGEQPVLLLRLLGRAKSS